jgi:hypothetical protein
MSLLKLDKRLRQYLLGKLTKPLVKSYLMKALEASWAYKRAFSINWKGKVWSKMKPDNLLKTLSTQEEFFSSENVWKSWKMLRTLLNDLKIVFVKFKSSKKILNFKSIKSTKISSALSTVTQSQKSTSRKP